MGIKSGRVLYAFEPNKEMSDEQIETFNQRICEFIDNEFTSVIYTILDDIKVQIVDDNIINLSIDIEHIDTTISEFEDEISDMYEIDEDEEDEEDEEEDWLEDEDEEEVDWVDDENEVWLDEEKTEKVRDLNNDGLVDTDLDDSKRAV